MVFDNPLLSPSDLGVYRTALLLLTTSCLQILISFFFYHSYSSCTWRWSWPILSSATSGLCWQWTRWVVIPCRAPYAQDYGITGPWWSFCWKNVTGDLWKVSLGHPRSPEVTIVFFCNNFWLNRDRYSVHRLSYLPRQYGSNYMQCALFRSGHDLDLRWNFQLDLSWSYYISINAPGRA